MVHGTLGVWVPEINSSQLREAIIERTSLLKNHAVLIKSIYPYCTVSINIASSISEITVQLIRDKCRYTVTSWRAASEMEAIGAWKESKVLVTVYVNGCGK